MPIQAEETGVEGDQRGKSAQAHDNGFGEVYEHKDQLKAWIWNR